MTYNRGPWLDFRLRLANSFKSSYSNLTLKYKLALFTTLVSVAALGHIQQGEMEMADLRVDPSQPQAEHDQHSCPYPYKALVCP